MVLISACAKEAPTPEVIRVCIGLYSDTEIGNDTAASTNYLDYDGANYYFYVRDDYYNVHANNFDFDRGVDFTLYYDGNTIEAIVTNFTCSKDCEEMDYVCMDKCDITYTANITEVKR